MLLSIITVADFKALFARDFPYLPTWIAGTYNKDTVVYYAVDKLFYKAKANGVVSIPTTTADWDLVTDNVLNYVADTDITEAFAEAEQMLNQALFCTDADITRGYLYLTAHMMVTNLQNSMQGVFSKGSQVLASKGAGSVNASYAIPEKYINDPNLNAYVKTGYGLKYLNMVYPRLVGHVSIAIGRTTP